MFPLKAINYPGHSMYKKVLYFVFINFSIHLVAMKVAIFDVGQGNCTLVVHPHKRAILVDAGTSKLPFDSTSKDRIQTIVTKIVELVPQKRITIVVSHGDRDHYSWIVPICSYLLQLKFKLSFLLGGSPQDFPSFSRSLKLPQASFKFTSQPSAQENNYGLPSYCTILSAEQKSSNKNDKSIILKVEYQGIPVILPADATGKITEKLLHNPKALKNALLLASHHGAATEGSNNLTWLKAISPQCFVISAGMHEGYHHPAQNTLRWGAISMNPDSIISPHPVTFYGDHNDLNDSHCKGYLQYENGYGIMITDRPIYNTTDTGDIEFIIGKQGITIDYARYIHADSFKECILRGIEENILNHVQTLNLNKCQFTDKDMAKITIIPQALKLLNVESNTLTPRAIIKLLELFIEHPQYPIIKVKNNGFRSEDFEKALYKNSALQKLTMRYAIFNNIKKAEKEKSLIEDITLSQKSDKGQGKYSPPAYLISYTSAKRDSALTHTTEPLYLLEYTSGFKPGH